MKVVVAPHAIVLGGQFINVLCLANPVVSANYTPCNSAMTKAVNLLFCVYVTYLQKTSELYSSHILFRSS
jgi:hypothetical protein